MEIAHQRRKVNGVEIHYAEVGEGPLVVMLHGFPELWYSWRHQLVPLAHAGYRVVAPDLRGFGQSEVSARTEDYSLLSHAQDMTALIATLGDQPVLVGHDWGANLMWALAVLHPRLARALVGVSIPFYPQPRDPAQIKASSRGHFNFAAYFARPGAAEAEFESDPRRFFRTFLYGLSGEAPRGTVDALYLGKPEDAALLDGFPPPPARVSWLTEEDLEVYVSSFRRTGLKGALGFYRNIEADYPRLRDAYHATITQPVLFVGGAEEAAVRFGSIEPMRGALANLREVLLLPGCGHWVQQERPAEFNRALLAFLKREVT
jgi:epoxide hydrolase A/B